MEDGDFYPGEKIASIPPAYISSSSTHCFINNSLRWALNSRDSERASLMNNVKYYHAFILQKRKSKTKNKKPENSPLCCVKYISGDSIASFWQIAPWFRDVVAVISHPRKGGSWVLLSKRKKIHLFSENWTAFKELTACEVSFLAIRETTT